jgi:hypothetical protein
MRRLALAGLVIAVSTNVRAQSGVVAGRVLEAASERPVANARVGIPSRALETRTDSAGRFRLASVAPGEFVVLVHAVGFDSLVANVRLALREDIDADFMVSRPATTLAKVNVESTRSLESLRLADFEERRKLGLGRFLQQPYFELNGSRQLDQVIVSRIPALRVRRVAGRTVLASTHDGATCYPQVVVNGISLWNGVPDGPGAIIARETLIFDINTVPTGDIIGFEFHTPASTPTRYNATGAGKDGSACGTAIIWTK